SPRAGHSTLAEGVEHLGNGVAAQPGPEARLQQHALSGCRRPPQIRPALRKAISEVGPPYVCRSIGPPPARDEMTVGSAAARRPTRSARRSGTWPPPIAPATGPRW